MTKLSRFSRKTLQFLFIVAISGAATFALEEAGSLQQLEDVYLDYWHQFAGKRRDAQYSAVIAIDDETLLLLKDDPLAFWAPYWAVAMSNARRAGVKAMGLDFIYTVSAESWLKKLKLPDSQISRNYDSPLRAQLASGDIVLITHLVDDGNGSVELLAPPPDQMFLLPRQSSDTGVANLEPDGDKLVRHFYPVFIPSDPAGLGFPMQLALRGAGLDPTAPTWEMGGEKIDRTLKMRRIGYVGPPGTIPIVSMSKLLKPGALADPEVQALKGRVAVIAANNAGTSDRHFTPYSRALPGRVADQMIGGEIHANIIETLMSGRYPHALPAWLRWAYVLGVLALVAFYYLRFHPLRGFALGVGLGLACTGPAYFAFVHDWVLPVGSVQAALGIAFLATIGLRLTGEERQRAKLRAQFGRYVSDDVVNLLTEGERPDLAGEEVTVTVLFSDIRNFTTISEQLSAHEVVEMLNAYFSTIGEPILVQGGNLNKYMGDAVMAIFGSPIRHPDHARRALLAGVEMRGRAEEFRAWMEQRFPDRGLPTFRIGIGMHTGPAVVGDIGSKKRTEFTAIGDTVNAASRLEGVTKEMGCVLVASAQTVQAAGVGVSIGRRETVRVKGRNEPIEVLEILGLDGEQAR